MAHWYTSEAQPMHRVEGNNGKMRDTTVRDARQLNLFPSVTAIINLLDKPGLNNWKQGQIARAAIDNPIEKGELFKDWVARIKKLGKEETEKTATIGTDIHEAIRQIWEGSVAFNQYHNIAEGAVDAIIEYCGTDDFIPELTVVGKGYGGQIDLLGKDYIIDYKTKDISDHKYYQLQSDKPPKMAYDEECMQLSAYREAVASNSGMKFNTCSKMLNVFVDRTIPGRVYIYEHTENMYAQFQCLVGYWQIAKKYIPEQN